jgi:hypothetical protein
MASKRRIRRNQCGKKKRYSTEQAARHAIWVLSKTAGPIGYMNVYRCGFCSQFHIGHARKP